MRTRGCVFESQRFWSPYGTAQPADVLPDVSRYGNDGAFSGAGEPNWVQLPSGLWTLDFDGTDDRIAIAHHPSHWLTAGGTLMAWINPDNAGKNNVGRIIDKSSGPNADNGYSCYTVPGTNLLRIALKINTGGGIMCADDAIPIGSFSFIAITFTAAGAIIHYVNGVLSGTPASSNAASGITDTGPLYIGDRGTDTANFDGTIALPMIYNYVLSPDAINKMYQADRYLLGV